MQFLYIFLCGGLVAVSRYGLSATVQSLSEHTRLHRFPVGILTCNLLGCLFIGFVFGWIASQNNNHPSWLHPLAITGFLGGFTTFSTFSLDSHELFSSSPLLAILNISISLIGGLLAVWLGFKLASMI